MQQLIIGDIHGCHDELQELLDRAGLGAGDEIIALGDAVDRGPDSVGVLALLREHPGASSIQGNHERKHVRSFAGELCPALSQQITRRQLGEAAYPRACAFMAAMPRHRLLDEALLVHGFWEPGVALDDQRDTVVIGTLSGQRHLDRTLERPWYELYDGDRPLICGHHDYLRSGQPLVYRDRVFGLDTSCCRGGALTGLLLPGWRIISVPARADHWSATQRRYADLRLQGDHDDSLPWDKIRALLALPDQRDDLEPELLQRLDRLERTRRDAEAKLAALQQRVRQENERLLGQLREQGPHDDLSPREQGSAYARVMGQHPLAGWLHLERRGLLDLNALRRRLKTPREVFRVATKVGLAG